MMVGALENAVSASWGGPRHQHGGISQHLVMALNALIGAAPSNSISFEALHSTGTSEPDGKSARSQTSIRITRKIGARRRTERTEGFAPVASAEGEFETVDQMRAGRAPRRTAESYAGSAGAYAA
jgi:hypothetical protein